MASHLSNSIPYQTFGFHMFMAIDVSYCRKEKPSLADKEGAFTQFQHELHIRTNDKFSE